MPGVSVVVVVTAAVLVAVTLALGARSSGAAGRPAALLRRLAVVVTAVVAALTVVPAWRDSGTFALALVGVPLGCAGAVLAVDLARPRSGRWVAPVTALAAAVMLTWSLVTALGAGLALGIPAVLMLAAAVASVPRQRPPRPQGSPVRPSGSAR